MPNWVKPSYSLVLEQLSISLSRQGIASMGEPRDGILGSDRLYGHTHCLPERLAGAGAEPAQDGFDFRERLLDRREVGRVRGQEEQLAVARFNRLANAGSL